MTYLSVSNFWKYQNADVWKKSKTHPPWFKHYVHRDPELDKLPVCARLLFWELLAAATRYSNVLEADLNWLYAETRVEPERIAEMLPLLLEGGWLSETKSRRRSRKSSREYREGSVEQQRTETEEDSVSPQNRMSREDQDPVLSDFTSPLWIVAPSAAGIDLVMDVLDPVDENTRQVIEEAARGLNENQLRVAREDILAARVNTNRTRYAVGMLRRMRRVGQEAVA